MPVAYPSCGDQKYLQTLPNLPHMDKITSWVKNHWVKEQALLGEFSSGKGIHLSVFAYSHKKSAEAGYCWTFIDLWIFVGLETPTHHCSPFWGCLNIQTMVRSYMILEPRLTTSAATGLGSQTTSAGIFPEWSGLAQWQSASLFHPCFQLRTNQRKPIMCPHSNNKRCPASSEPFPASPNQPSLMRAYLKLSLFLPMKLFHFPCLALNLCQRQVMVGDSLAIASCE